jgi:putative SOS response-associated peptidase YedK
MCNLYYADLRIMPTDAAKPALMRAMHDRTGNPPPLPGIFPDYVAPIVRNTADGRELTMAPWGMPSPVFALKGRNSDPGVTNVRNTASPHWRRWLAPKSHCVVPFTGFSENETGHGRIGRS